MKARTTVTFDPDVQAGLESEMRKTGKSFKETVNEAVRAGLVSRGKRPADRPFKIKSWDMGLKSGYSFDKPWDLIEEVEGPGYK